MPNFTKNPNTQKYTECLEKNNGETKEKTIFYLNGFIKKA